MKVLVAVMLGTLLSGCTFMKALDYDGNPKEPFEFRFGWDHGVVPSTAAPGKVDDKGIYQPETEGAQAALSFPGVSTGLLLEVEPKARVTPTVGLELFRYKTPVPFARWWVAQVGGGAQVAEIYVGKLLVPVVDVTAGPWYGWDFDKHKGAFGAQFTIFKF